MTVFKIKSFSLVLCLTLCIFGASSLDASNEAPAGQIIKTSGKVFLLKKGQEKLPAQANQKFFPGDTILTEDGLVKLEFVEGKNEVVLGRQSSLLIDRAGKRASGQDGTSLSLKEGQVRSVVKKKYSGAAGDVFEVKTPNAVAGVRGTVFTVSYDQRTAQSWVATEQGAVMFKSAASETLVSRGMISMSLGAGRVSTPVEIKSNPIIEKEVKKMNQGATLKEESKSDSDMSASTDSAVSDSSPLASPELSVNEKGEAVVKVEDPVLTKSEVASTSGNRSPASTPGAANSSSDPGQKRAAPDFSANLGFSKVEKQLIDPEASRSGTGVVPVAAPLRPIAIQPPTNSDANKMLGSQGTAGFVNTLPKGGRVKFKIENPTAGSGGSTP